MNQELRKWLYVHMYVYQVRMYASRSTPFAVYQESFLTDDTQYF